MPSSSGSSVPVLFGTGRFESQRHSYSYACPGNSVNYTDRHDDEVFCDFSIHTFPLFFRNRMLRKCWSFGVRYNVLITPR